jgi:glycosyltransferase involved in cell wall biosynthesis
MRLVAVIDRFEWERPDGASRTLWETARALRRAGHEVVVAAGGPTAGEVTRERIIVRRVERAGDAATLAGRRRWLPALRRVAEGAAREARAEAVWLHRTVAVDAAAPVAERLGIPLVVACQAPWADELATAGASRLRWRERRPRAAAEARACRAAAVVQVGSAPLRERLRATHPRVATTGLVVPAAVDPARFAPRPGRAAERAALRIPGDACLVVAIRRCTPGHGLDHLLDGLAGHAIARPALHVALGGHGPAADALAARCAAHPLGDRLRWLGAPSDDTLARWLGVADLVVAPASVDDWTGLSVREALACGTPVLASMAADRAGLAAAVDPGLILPAATPAALAAGLQAWGGAPARLAALRARCAATAAGATWDGAAAALLAALARL